MYCVYFGFYITFKDFCFKNNFDISSRLRGVRSQSIPKSPFKIHRILVHPELLGLRSIIGNFTLFLPKVRKKSFKNIIAF